MKDIPELLLIAVDQQKKAIDQILPALAMIKKGKPKYSELEDCFKNIQSELGKAQDILKEMR